MNFKTTLMYRLISSVLTLIWIFTLIAAVALTAHVISPFLSSRTASLTGYSKFNAGIPFQLQGSMEIPDSSFHHSWENKTGGISTSIHYVNAEEVSSSRPEPDAAEIVNFRSDTIVTHYLGAGYIDDPTIKGARINSITLYLWPQNIGRRFLLFLPVLLGLLTLGFCAWQLSRLLQEIMRIQAFKKQSYRRLEFIGLALIFLQLVCIGLAYTEPYTHSYQVAFQSNIEDYRTPITMIANAMNPFNLYWFILGCVIFILARGFQFGNQLQLQQDQTI